MDEDSVAIVTGATSGLGREVALGLAATGARVVVVGRGIDRARAVAEEIGQRSGSGRIESLGVTDLSSLGEMHRTAEELGRRYPHVRVLVNNAGAVFARREITADGLERTFALNVLAPFVLTYRLAPQLASGMPSRVIEVSSAAHRGRRIDLADLQTETRYAAFRAYGRSKLALLLLTREFGRRLSPSGISVNAVHPGFVRSGFGQNNGGWFARGLRVAMALFGRSAARGALTPIYLATDPSVHGTTGGYFADRRPRAGSVASRDLKVARALFERCQRLTGLESTPLTGPVLPRPAPQV